MPRRLSGHFVCFFFCFFFFFFFFFFVLFFWILSVREKLKRVFPLFLSSDFISVGKHNRATGRRRGARQAMQPVLQPAQTSLILTSPGSAPFDGLLFD